MQDVETCFENLYSAHLIETKIAAADVMIFVTSIFK